MRRRHFKYDYVAVGHVTIDVLDKGGATVRQPGGGALYSGLQAARLGLRTLVITRGRQAEIFGLIGPLADELDVHVLPAPHTTTLATFSSGQTRTQRLLAWAGQMELPTTVKADILHLAPIASETPPQPPAGAGFVAITPQGLIRAWRRQGDLLRHVDLSAEALPRHFDAAVISERERAHCEPLLAAASGCGATVAVTSDAGPTVLRCPEGCLQLSPRRVRTPVDDLGAGDVFAAAMFVALREGARPREAARFASAAAALRVSGAGPAAIADRAAIESLL